MNSDLDATLSRLAQTMHHPSLESVHDAVMARLRAASSERAGLGLTALAAAGAMAFGTFAAGTAPAAAQSSPLTPFSAANPLAPSTLLLDGQ